MWTIKVSQRAGIVAPNVGAGRDIRVEALSSINPKRGEILVTCELMRQRLDAVTCLQLLDKMGPSVNGCHH